MLTFDEHTTIPQLECELTVLGATSLRIYSASEISQYAESPPPDHRWAAMIIAERDNAPSVIAFGTGVLITDALQATAIDLRTKLLASLGFEPIPVHQMPLPENPPVDYYVDRKNLEAQGVKFVDGIACHRTSGVTFVDGAARDAGSFYFQTYDDRTWAYGPYQTRRACVAARKRYLKLTDGPAIRTWSV